MGETTRGETSCGETTRGGNGLGRNVPDSHGIAKKKKIDNYSVYRRLGSKLYYAILMIISEIQSTLFLLQLKIQSTRRF